MTKGKKGIIVIVLGLIFIGIGLFLFFGTDLFKKKDNNNSNSNKNNEAKDFVGIYVNGDDILYIREAENNEIHYMISGNFEGFAIIEGDSAKEKRYFEDNIYNEFKIVTGGIEFIYHAPEDHEIACATGKYLKVADYSKDNVYKMAVGDASLLSSKYSGIYKNGDTELCLYQINEKQVKVATTDDYSFSQTFDIESDTKMTGKTIFDEDNIAYEIVFNNQTITLKVDESLFGVGETEKALEGSYTFEKAITQDEIMNNFYSRY